MPDKCPGCPSPSAEADGFITVSPVSGPRSEGSGVSGSEGPFVQEAPQTGHLVLMGTLGADGNPGSLPDVPQVGWAYVAGDAGTYGGVQATEGDVVYCMSLNPVKWGVLQADSDDSGRDLVSVAASFECDFMENYAPYGPAAEIAVYDSGMNVLGRSDNISAPGGLLEVPPLQDVPWRLQDPDFSAVAFVSVRFTSAEYDGDAFSMYEAVVSLASWEALSFDNVLFCETSCSVVCLGPDRCALRMESASAAGGRTFQILAVRGPLLFLTSTKASGASSTQTVDMSCLNDRITSVSASFGCDPSPVLSLTSAKADGTSSSQDVDMSCLVPPVFNGSVNGLVPVNSPATQTADLLSDDGTWMRPATDAEIDALFVEPV